MKNKTDNLLKKIFSTLIITIPITRIYQSVIPGVSVAEFLLASVMFYIILTSKAFLINKNQTKILIVWLLIVILSLISFLIQGKLETIVVTRLIRTTFYIFVLIFSVKYFSINDVLNIYKYLTIFSGLIVIIQVVSYRYFNANISFDFLSLFIHSKEYDVQFDNSNVTLFRSSGIFLEPSHFAQFMLPGLALSAFNNKTFKKQDLSWFLFILLSIILSSSSNGIIISIIITIIVLVIKMFERLSFKYIFLVTGFLLLGLLVFYYQNDYVFYTLNKIRFNNIVPGSSSALRLYRGWAVFSELPFINKIIGVGHGNMGPYVLANGISTIFDRLPITLVQADYANGISSFFVYYGIVISSILLYYAYILFKKSDVNGKLLIITLLMIMLTSAVTINLIFIFYISIIIGMLIFNKSNKAKRNINANNI